MNLTLLVADPGGHLALASWIRPCLDRCTWVSLDTVDVRARVAPDPVIFGHGPTARSSLALVRNLRQAAAVLPKLAPDRVLTTGAGLGVPWLWVAKGLGIPTAFLEVADRRQRPSLSLRLAGPVVDHVLVQHAAGRSFRADAVVVGPIRPPTASAVPRPGPVFVSMGTGPHPFERLVLAAEALAATGVEVFVQHGASRAPVGCPSSAFLAPDAFRHFLRTARVVVLHGGQASRLEAQALGRVPVVVPRRAGRGEHVDDHQVHAAAADGGPVVEASELVAFLQGWSEPPAAAPGADALDGFRDWWASVGG